MLFPFPLHKDRFMRFSRTITTATMALLIVAQSAAAQNAPPALAPATATATPTAYGTTGTTPVSKWTPAASVGRQLTLPDLLSWKGLRNLALSNEASCSRISLRHRKATQRW